MGEIASTQPHESEASVRAHRVYQEVRSWYDLYMIHDSSPRGSLRKGTFEAAVDRGIDVPPL